MKQAQTAAIVSHPRTASQLQRFIDQPSHAVLLVGPSGIGKTYLAEHLATSALGLPPGALHNHPYYLGVGPVNNSISIEVIRELQKFLQLKTPGTEQSLRRAVVIEHAEGLTTEAQNAFLKLLEEPPADTIILLTADNRRALLPTILSRVQLLAVHTPAEAEVKTFFATTGDAAAINQAYFLSGGLPGLMHALLQKDATHPLTEGVAQAKLILQKSTFERLAMVESLAKQKEQAASALDALTHIARVGITQATAKGDPAKLKQWHRILKLTQAAREALLVNANTKLTLTNLMLSL